MNIWLPIVTNTIIATILILGIISGRKYGWRLALTKFVLVCGAGVGAYYLTVPILSLLSNWEWLTNVINGLNLSLNSVLAIVMSLTFLVLYLIVSLICSLIYNKRKVIKLTNSNVAKVKRAKAIDRKEERALRREERKLARLNVTSRELRKTSRVFGSIFGLFIAIIVGYALMLPCKYIFNDVAKNTELPINSGYEYTMYGQLDKITNLSEKLLGE